MRFVIDLVKILFADYDLNVFRRRLVFELGVKDEDEMEETLVG